MIAAPIGLRITRLVENNGVKARSMKSLQNVNNLLTNIRESSYYSVRWQQLKEWRVERIKELIRDWVDFHDIDGFLDVADIQQLAEEIVGYRGTVNAPQNPATEQASVADLTAAAKRKMCCHCGQPLQIREFCPVCDMEDE